MRKKLSYNDFEPVVVENNLPYFTLKENNIKINIKPAMDGFEVSVFKNGKKPEPTVSTNLVGGIDPQEAFLKALHLAQLFYDKYSK